MEYTTTAHDPEIGAARVSGAGDTPEKSVISCLNNLCRYLQNSVRWAGQEDFVLKTKCNK